MTFTKEQQKLLLGASIAVIVLVNGYRLLTAEGPRTAPLVYNRGAVASSPVRQGAQVRGSAADPLRIFLERSAEPYPGVVRDIFRMQNPVVRPKTMPAPPVVVTTPPPPEGPVKTAEEIAADLVRADLAKFRYLGYVIEKDTTVFLSKESELFIVKNGDRIGPSYKVKEANKDYVVILDPVTHVEGRVSLSGEGASQQPPATAAMPPRGVQPPGAVQQPVVQQPQFTPQPFPPQPFQPRTVQPDRSRQPQTQTQQPAGQADKSMEQSVAERIQKRRQRTGALPPPE